MANKKTQKDFFNDIIALAKANDRADLVEFAEGRIEALNKKATKTNTKHNTEVEANTALVFEALQDVAEPITASELIKSATNEVSEWSTAKVSAYLKKLVEGGKVTKTTEKKVSRFILA